MIERVIKRDGRKVVFSKRRIRTTISKAMDDAGVSTYNAIQPIVSTVINALNVKYDGTIPTVEQVQDTIVEILKEMELGNVAQTFIDYRNDRTRIRETKSDVMKAINRIGAETERDNANVGNNFSAKLLQIASIANKWANLAKMPKEHSKFHESGDGHIHDLDSFNLALNCLHVPLGETLERGFNPGYGSINKPKRLESAVPLACILLQSTQNDMFGGQSFDNFDNDMAPYVDMTRQEIKTEYTKLNIKENLDELIEEKLINITHQSMQVIVYNLNTMHSRAGSQVPFSSINLGIPKSKDAALVCEAFLKEYDKGLGKNEQPIFPKYNWGIN
jgi:ribonucleoside-triphosphate reductase